MGDRRINTTKGRIKELLNNVGFKSIRGYKSYLEGTNNTVFTTEQIHQILIENHNEAVELIQQNIREEKLQAKRDLKHRTKHLNQFEDVIDPHYSKQPISDDTQRNFKNVISSHSFSNPNNVRGGYKSFSIINYSIPIIRQKLKQHQNLKVVYSFSNKYVLTLKAICR